MRVPAVALILLILVAACSSGGGAGDAAARDGAVDLLRDRQALQDVAGDDAADATPGASDRCGGGALIDPGETPVVTSDTTSGATNQYGSSVRCGGADPLVGPQRYFRVAMEAGKSYRLTVEPQFEAALYLSSACAINVINADCGSGGATGALVGPVAPGARGELLFFPSASGVYILALDSLSADAAGAFELTVEEFGEPENGRCEEPADLPLVDGSATVHGRTLGAHDEFGGNLVCGLGLTLDGPQVYYTVALEPESWYRLSLTADFAASLYLANTEGGCDSLNIEQDCSSITGTVMPAIAAGGTGLAAFAPPIEGTYLVAVDSLHPGEAGDFTLSVDRFDPPPTSVCERATAVSLEEDKAVISGDTTSGFNDRGALVGCGGAPLVGPQAYYVVALQQRSYQLTLDAGFDAVLAVGKDCLTLPADCGSNGLDGAVLRVPSGQPGTLVFTPSAQGAFVLVVDSTIPGERGAFQLSIGPALGPENGKCETPQPLTLPAAVPGDTGPLRNDVEGVSCGDAAGPWPGPQAYFRVTVPGGRTARVSLEPEATFDAALYAFPRTAGCAADAINAGCTGLSSDAPGAGTAETVDLSPASDVEYVIVVDSWSPSEVGSFTLQVALL
jgi:hypothetical protein